MNPTNKATVTNTAMGGAVATIIVYCFSAFTDVPIGAEVAAALATLFAMIFGAFGKDPT
jgi:hypothetical protein